MTTTMKRKTPHPLADEALHAWVDGQLGTADRHALALRLKQDSEARSKVDQWQRQRQRLRALAQPVMDEPVPAALLAAASNAAKARQTVHQWRRWGGIAAGILLSFGTGWWASQAWDSQHPAAALARSSRAADFVRQASYAHSVYTPELRHPVEVGAAEQGHLVAWLSKRLGKPLKVPDLTAQGYALIGGRLLPGDTGARAQFMFQNPAGNRITLYLGAVGDKAAGTDAQETAFRYAAEGAVSSFYWVDQGFGYALAGTLPRAALMQLAQTVYQELAK